MQSIHPNLIQKQALKTFWNRFGQKKNQGVGFAEAEKLSALIELSSLVIRFRKQQPRLVRREKFDKAKEKLHNLRTRRICFVCGDPAQVRHHSLRLLAETK